MAKFAYIPLEERDMPEGRIELPTQLTAFVTGSLLGVCGICGIHSHLRCYDFYYDFSRGFLCNKCSV